MANTSRRSSGGTRRKSSSGRPKGRAPVASRKHGGGHVTPRPVNVPHIEESPEDPSRLVENHEMERAVGAGNAVDNLSKLLSRSGGPLKMMVDRRVRRPHPEGLDDFTERKYGGKQRGLHLVIRDWETNYRGHVSNGTNVDIRAWGFPEEAVVRYSEREQWAIGEAPFRRAWLAIESANKRFIELVLKCFGVELPAPN